MNPRRYLPSLHRQTARSATAERVPRPRPHLDSDPLDNWPPTREECEQTPEDWAPTPPRPRFVPHPRAAGGRQHAGPRDSGGWIPPLPRPRFIPRPQPAGDDWAHQAGEYTAVLAPFPPATPWEPMDIEPPQPPAIEHPGQPRAIESSAPAPAVAPSRPARAIIGDEIRVPILWCEFGQCIEWYTDADALGERDLRVRAYEAGWRYDALSRLACPYCAQCDASFWSSRLPVLLYRY